ncbi:dihydrofolate reductase [Candidatus Falkowbacteria bacterium]|jgi:dihydrofolate reductase|nr:dihydrofolate reductase [Candidatus Falkowbacteria bacterium]MBT7007664.1 dihydrofolate reductase [Candidatus Falkowbacteria bacterium]
MLTRLIMVMTADGVIAKGSDHNPMDWTSAEDKAHFKEVSKDFGVMIMGQSSYDAIGSPLPGRLNIVLTKEKRTDQPGLLEHKQGDIKVILQELEKRGHDKVLICGGTFVNSLFLQENLIDEIQISIEPKLFGSGLRLFDKIDINTDLHLIKINKLNNNTINLLYKVIKK